MVFKLTSLPYELDALAPYMSKKTLELHYGKHHLAYVNNLNNLLESKKEMQSNTLEEIIVKTYNKPEYAGIFNNAAQNYNHIEFWKMMKKNVKPSNKLMDALAKAFGSFEKFKEEFILKGTTLFGSGWVWLAKNSDGSLEIIQCSNGVNPIALGKKVVLGCDVWEHSYYVDYENRRPEFLKTWMENLVNWEYVESKL